MVRKGLAAATARNAWALVLACSLAACTRTNLAYEGSSEGGEGEGEGEGTSRGGPSSSGADGAATTAGSVDGDCDSGSDGSSGDPCALDNGGCHAEATCNLEDEGVVCTCDPGFAGNGFVCEPEAFLRVELPCLGNMGNCGESICSMDSASTSTTLDGDEATLYTVTLHVRGVVELRTYDGGTFHGWYNEGGVASGVYNSFGLDVTEPEATYFLNARESGLAHSCEAIDEELEVVVRGGSEIRLHADSSDGCGLENMGPDDVPIVIPEVPPAPQPFDGQLIQIDLLEVAAL